MARRRPVAEPWQPDWSGVGAAQLEFLLIEAKEYLAATVAMDRQATEHAAGFCGVFGPALLPPSPSRRACSRAMRRIRGS